MQANQGRRTFLTLDGLRAVGAFLVVMRHVPFLFGPIAVPESFLAVDLFYLVSGFVVAHAYRERLEAGGFFLTFVKTRLIRLYPFYFCGMVLGVLAALASIITDPEGWWTPAKLIFSIATGLFMVPFLPGMPSNGSSLDGPTWTLLPELIANFVYALLVRFLNTWTLLAIIGVFGAGMVLIELKFGTLDVGFAATDLWAALVRVGFSFFTGVLLFRLSGHRQQHVEWMSWALVLLLTVLLAWRPDESMKPLFELAVVLFGFPLLLVLAANFEPGAGAGKVFSFLGLLSYGIYIVHQPLGNLARFALGRDADIPEDYTGLIYGAVFLVILTVVAWRIDRDIDAPARKILRRIFLQEGNSSR